MVLFNINNITTLGLANNTSLTLSSWLLTLALVLNAKLQDGGKPMVLGGRVGFNSSGQRILSHF